MQPLCKNCGHLPVCHRRGPCEHVKREGWNSQFLSFAKETPCECPGFQQPVTAKTALKPKNSVL